MSGTFADVRKRKQLEGILISSCICDLVFDF